MLVFIFLALFVCVIGDGAEPKFQVLTPDELMVEVPHYEDAKLVTFRIGVRRAGRDGEDLEMGENDLNNHRVFIYDQRLNLKEGDVVNYLLAFRDKRGYQAQSGNYHFNGVYYKKPFGRRNRFRRHLTERPQVSVESTEEFNPTEPRFGHHPHRGWNRYPGFNPWGLRPYTPGFPPPGPNFGNNCNDHKHDRCHGRDTERWEAGEGFQHDVEYHCKICNGGGGIKATTTTTTTTTTEENSPDIDIRFGD